MKKALLLSFVVVSSGVVYADEYYDDIYYNPNKQVEITDSYDAGEVINGRDVDEYNRFGGYYETAIDTIGATVSSGEDFVYTKQIQKFYNPTIVVDNSETLEEVLQNSYGNVDIVVECGMPQILSVYNYPAYVGYNSWYWNPLTAWDYAFGWYSPWSWWYSYPTFCYDFWWGYYHPHYPFYPGYGPGMHPHHPGHGPHHPTASWNPRGNGTHRVDGGWHRTARPGDNPSMANHRQNSQRGVSANRGNNGYNHRGANVAPENRVSGSAGSNHRVSGRTENPKRVSGAGNTSNRGGNATVNRQNNSSSRSGNVSRGSNNSYRSNGSYQNRNSGFNQGSRSSGRSSGSFGGGRSSGGGGHRGGGGRR